jgi:LPXTG-motif cell wall-anchored protein
LVLAEILGFAVSDKVNEVSDMYTLGDKTPIAAGVVTAVVLPNTGVSSNVVTLAAAVFVGLAVWGVMYARANR